MRSTDFPFAVTPRRFDKGGPSFADRARTVAKGAMFAGNDEAEAFLRALMQLNPDAYASEVANIRKEQKAYEDANKAESFGLEMAGGLLPALLPGGQGVAATRMAALAAKSPLAARIAPVIGEAGLYGVGAADSMADIPRSVGEEMLFGLGMYGAGAALGPPLKKLGVKAANAVGDRVLGPRVENLMYSDKIGGPQYKPGDTLPAYGVRNIFRPAELDDIVSSGFMRPPPDRARNTTRKYFTMTDAEVPSAANQQAMHIRVPSNRIPQGRAVRAKDVEIWDNEAGEFRKLLAVKKKRK